MGFRISKYISASSNEVTCECREQLPQQPRLKPTALSPAQCSQLLSKSASWYRTLVKMKPLIYIGPHNWNTLAVSQSYFVNIIAFFFCYAQLAVSPERAEKSKSLLSWKEERQLVTETLPCLTFLSNSFYSGMFLSELLATYPQQFTFKYFGT